MRSTRRTILAAGAAAAATSAVPRLFAQQSGEKGAGKFYERGPVRIYYEEAGSGFPLLLLPGGGLNSTIGFFAGNSPFILKIRGGQVDSHAFAPGNECRCVCNSRCRTTTALVPLR